MKTFPERLQGHFRSCIILQRAWENGSRDIFTQWSKSREWGRKENNWKTNESEVSSVMYKILERYIWVKEK